MRNVSAWKRPTAKSKTKVSQAVTGKHVKCPPGRRFGERLIEEEILLHALKEDQG